MAKDFEMGGIILDYLSEPHVISVPHQREAGGLEAENDKEVGCRKWGEEREGGAGRFGATGLKVEEGLLESGKGKGRDSALELPEGGSPANTLVLGF